MKNRLNKVLDAARKIASGATGEPSDKVRYLHDKLCENCNYNSNYEGIYSALIEGRGVCSSYANTFKLLCDLCEIPCMIVSGTSEGESHSWNIVQLQDGEWYEIDVTFDDDKKGYDYNYFLLTTKEMSKDHKRGSDIYTKFAPTANGKTYSISKYKGKTFTAKKSGAKYKVDIFNNKATLVSAPKKAKNFTVPETITCKGHKVNIQQIESNAFSKCNKLKNVTISKNVREIKKNAFDGCKNLKNITVKSDSLYKIGKDAFNNISSKPIIMLPASDAQYYKKLFKKSGITKKAKYSEIS